MLDVTEKNIQQKHRENDLNVLIYMFSSVNFNMCVFMCSFDPSLSSEEREQKMRQATVRAGFVQDLVLSTLFTD